MGLRKPKQKEWPLGTVTECKNCFTVIVKSKVSGQNRRFDDDMREVAWVHVETGRSMCLLRYGEPKEGC